MDRMTPWRRRTLNNRKTYGFRDRDRETLGKQMFFANSGGGGSGPKIKKNNFLRGRPPGGLAAPERLFTSPEEFLKKSRILKKLYFFDLGPLDPY